MCDTCTANAVCSVNDTATYRHHIINQCTLCVTPSVIWNFCVCMCVVNIVNIICTVEKVMFLWFVFRGNEYKFIHWSIKFQGISFRSMWIRRENTIIQRNQVISIQKVSSFHKPLAKFFYVWQKTNDGMLPLDDAFVRSSCPYEKSTKSEWNV